MNGRHYGLTAISGIGLPNELKISETNPSKDFNGGLTAWNGSGRLR